jgi:S1-C subfamily serine protease
MLVEAKPGDEVEITFLRDGKEMTTKATLTARAGGG